MKHSNKLSRVFSFFVAALALPACSFYLSAQDRVDIQNLETQGQATEQHVVGLRALDKITARITEIELPVGEEKYFGTLALRAKYCRTRPPIETPETFAYLEIDDIKHSGEREQVFKGWMVASSPALNALEHPVYDVWVISCKILSPAAGEGKE